MLTMTNIDVGEESKATSLVGLPVTIDVTVAVDTAVPSLQ